MAITLEDFVKQTNAEEVAGNIIIGIMATRRIVAKIENGSFNLNEEGQKIVAEIEAGTFNVAELAPVVDKPADEVANDKAVADEQTAVK